MAYQEVDTLIDDFSLEDFIKCRNIVRMTLEKHITKRPEFMEIMIGKNGKPIYCKMWVGRK